MRRTRLVVVTLTVVGLVVHLATAWSTAVLLSTSMEPWAGPGALLVHREVAAEQVEVGDVVTVRTRDGSLVSHRVVHLVADDGTVVARLQGDRSRLPDPVPVDLPDEVARVVLVVPALGDVLRVGGPTLGGALGLLALGATAVVVSRRRDHDDAVGDDATPRTDTVDPRLAALLATAEQLAEDGLADVVVRDLVRVRSAPLFGLPSAERAGAVVSLDDGARFYVVALADADPAALGIVPPGSARRREATAALEEWWAAVEDRVPDDARPVLPPGVLT